MLLALVAACSSSEADNGGSSAEATTTTVAETTTTTAAPDPFTVPEDPADIDEAYVEAVLAELERINGDALRLAVSEGLSPRITELIQSIYTPERAAEELDVLVQEYNAGLPGVRRPPGDVAATVSQLLTARRDCIALDGQLDYSAVSETATEPLPIRVELRPKADEESTNPTPWEIAVRTVHGGPAPLPEPCAASS